MDYREARKLLKERPDYRSELSSLLNKALKEHGLTKQVMQNDKVKHVVKHGYRKTRQTWGVYGQMYCPELWEILGSPHGELFPVFKYVPAVMLGTDESIFWIGEDLNVEEVNNHFHKVIESVIEPLVWNAQSPLEAARYAMHNPEIMMWSSAFKKRRLSIWANHFGIDFP